MAKPTLRQLQFLVRVCNVLLAISLCLLVSAIASASYDIGIGEMISMRTFILIAGGMFAAIVGRCVSGYGTSILQ